MFLSRRSLLVSLSALPAGACALSPEAPKYTDSLAELHNMPGTSAPLDVPVRAGPTVAIVFGSNIERVMQQKTDGDKILKSFGPLTNTSQLADTDPQPLISGAVSVIKLKYPQLVAVDDVATAAQRRMATTVVLDFLAIFRGGSGTRTTAKLVCVVLDARQMPVSRIESSGDTIVPYPAWNSRFRDASELALVDFKNKIASLLS